MFGALGRHGRCAAGGDRLLSPPWVSSSLAATTREHHPSTGLLRRGAFREGWRRLRGSLERQCAVGNPKHGARSQAFFCLLLQPNRNIPKEENKTSALSSFRLLSGNRYRWVNSACPTRNICIPCETCMHTPWLTSASTFNDFFSPAGWRAAKQINVPPQASRACKAAKRLARERPSPLRQFAQGQPSGLAQHASGPGRQGGAFQLRLGRPPRTWVKHRARGRARDLPPRASHVQQQKSLAIPIDVLV